MSGPAKDVVVVGAGNAALCAALAAAAGGAAVTVLEWAPEAEAGGNSAFTAGAMRVAYEGPEHLQELMDLSDDQLATTNFGSYPVTAFLADLERVTDGRCDPGLARVLAEQSRPTLAWMRSHGVEFEPSYGQQAFEVGGRWTFWGGLAVRVKGEGKGLMSALVAAVQRLGVDLRYGTRAVGLIQDGATVRGVRVQGPEGTEELAADAVVLASGGFEANPEWRARYLGPGWDLAKVRGTRYNTGDGIRMALEAGAVSHGHWSGCHSVAWDRDAPDHGDLAVAHQLTKNSYQFGIVVNSRGRRFLDEGADFRNYTYAAYGRELLAQPGHFAWQVFDSKVLPLLRDEYRRPEANMVLADTLEELARHMSVDEHAFLETVSRFNQACGNAPFDPNVKDGRGTAGIDPPKSNWANRLDQPPFQAFAVTCGITFTFGGVRIDHDARVLDVGGRPVPGLYAAGEMVGGLFYGNYPGGTGLTAGSVFGRIAGMSASSNDGDGHAVG